jgi:homopolymeric O-antigen transport system permease protein
MRNDFFLLRELVRRDFKGRYAGSVLGFLWSFVQPLWLLALFTFVFATVMRIPLTGQRTDNFAIFLFCGLLPWTAVQEGVMRSSTAITDNATLVKKLRFPSQILVLAVVLASLLHEGIAAAIFVGVLTLTGELAWRGLPLLLLALPLQLALTLGLGLALSAVHVFFRDTAQALGMLFTGWFYLTPIVYPLSLVDVSVTVLGHPLRIRPWIEVNPLTALVELYRQAFLGGRLALVPGTGALALLAAGALLFGWWLFRRFRPAFVDEI